MRCPYLFNINSKPIRLCQIMQYFTAKFSKLMSTSPDTLKKDDFAFLIRPLIYVVLYINEDVPNDNCIVVYGKEKVLWPVPSTDMNNCSLINATRLLVWVKTLLNYVYLSYCYQDVPAIAALESLTQAGIGKLKIYGARSRTTSSCRNVHSE